jgi:uncharacterized phiE125 gp8 family phage protein
MFCNGTTWQNYYPDRTTLNRTNNAEIRHTIRVVSPPAIEPLTISEAKAQLHIGESDNTYNAELAATVAAAREEWERDTSQALISRTLEHRLPRFLDYVELTVRPVVSIESVKYIDRDGDEQTVDANDYYLDGERVVFRSRFVRPSLEDRSEAVRIQYVAGYGESASSVPQFDKMAIKLSMANRFEDRDMISAGGERKAYEAMVAKKMRPSYP